MGLMRFLKPSFFAVLLAGQTLSSAQESSPSPAPSADPVPSSTIPLSAAPADALPPEAAASPSPTTVSPSAVLLPLPSSEAPLPEPGATPGGNGDSLFVQPPQSATAPGASTIPDLLPGTSGNQPVIRQSSTSSSLAELQSRIRYRQAKTRAINDPAIQQQLAFANAQTTEPEFRAEMRTYYQRLHDRILKNDPSLKTLADATLAQRIFLLKQERLRTTSSEEVRSARASVRTSAR